MPMFRVFTQPGSTPAGGPAWRIVQSVGFSQSESYWVSRLAKPSRTGILPTTQHDPELNINGKNRTLSPRAVAMTEELSTQTS